MLISVIIVTPSIYFTVSKGLIKEVVIVTREFPKIDYNARVPGHLAGS